METSEGKSTLYTELASMFNIGLYSPDETIFSMPLTDLLDEANMKRLIEAHMPLIKTTAPDASAVSIAIGAGNLAFAQQYAMSVYRVSIDFSLENLTLHLYMQDGYEAFGYTLKQWGEHGLPVTESGRNPLLQEKLFGTYRNTVRPLIELVSRMAAIHPRELWGQLPTNLRYYMGVWREAAESEPIRVRLEDDFRLLREELEPAAFGETVNPYRKEPILTEDLREQGRMIPVKNACCLYYKWGDGEYCFACPRVKESERETRRAAYRGM